MFKLVLIIKNILSYSSDYDDFDDFKSIVSKIDKKKFALKLLDTLDEIQSRENPNFYDYMMDCDGFDNLKYLCINYDGKKLEYSKKIFKGLKFLLKNCCKFLKSFHYIERKHGENSKEHEKVDQESINNNFFSRIILGYNDDQKREFDLFLDDSVSNKKKIRAIFEGLFFISGKAEKDSIDIKTKSTYKD